MKRCKNCNIALQTIETEVNNANVYKQKELENQASIDNEVFFFNLLNLKFAFLSSMFNSFDISRCPT
jgi:hypothetical protein